MKIPQMRCNTALLVICAVMMSVAVSAWGATSPLPPSGPLPAPKPAAPENYVLGPGDQIEVAVYGEPDLTHTVTIKPDGTITLALIDQVRAAGKTTAQLEAELTEMYSKYLKKPSVSVVVSTLRTDHVYLLGQVKSPGDYQLRPKVGVLELLASAGGATNRADLAKAVVIRGKTETINLDLIDAFVKNKPPDVKLQAGDILYIPETDRRIVVLGEVRSPGSYDLLEGQHLSDLLAASGGVTPKAAVTKAFIMRNNTQMPVDLKRVLDGDVQANVALVPGDMVIVPESKDRVIVLGAVGKPGPYDLTENMTLIDALAVAGGTTDKANLRGTQLVRLEGGKTKATPIKADQVMQGKDLSQNIALHNGDLIYVPERGMNFWEILNSIGIFRAIFGF